MNKIQVHLQPWQYFLLAVVLCVGVWVGVCLSRPIFNVAISQWHVSFPRENALADLTYTFTPSEAPHNPAEEVVFTSASFESAWTRQCMGRDIGAIHRYPASPHGTSREQIMHWPEVTDVIEEGGYYYALRSPRLICPPGHSAMAIKEVQFSALREAFKKMRSD